MNLELSAVILGNNHIADQGPVGIIDTLSVCSHAGLPTVGAGRTLAEARQPWFYEVKGIHLAVVAMAEHEFSIAGSNMPGANPLDYVNFTAIRRLHDKGNIVLVILHGGNEYFPYPRPGLVEVCHFLVDQGANAIIVQHTHCPGCYETYNGVPIVYGQGNLVFAKSIPKPSCWYEGFLVELQVGHNGVEHLSVYPYEQSRGFSGARRMSSERFEAFVTELEERNKVFGDAEALQELWLAFCREHRSSYIMRSFGYPRLIRGLNRLIPIVNWSYSCSTLLGPLNVAQCESHNEVLVTLLREEIKRRR